MVQDPAWDSDCPENQPDGAVFMETSVGAGLHFSGEHATSGANGTSLTGSPCTMWRMRMQANTQRQEREQPDLCSYSLQPEHYSQSSIAAPPTALATSPQQPEPCPCNHGHVPGAIWQFEARNGRECWAGGGGGVAVQRFCRLAAKSLRLVEVVACSSRLPQACW